jgi:hypothetical protein
MKTVTGQEILLPLYSKFQRTNVGHNEVCGWKGGYENGVKRWKEVKGGLKNEEQNE